MTITLKTIKSKQENTEYKKLLGKVIMQLMNKYQIKHVYFLGYFDWKYIFLSEGIVYFACYDKQKDVLEELYQVKLLKEYPKTLSDIDFKTICGNGTFTPEMFLDWIDMPCCITENIDEPYYEVIKFLSRPKKFLYTERYNYDLSSADFSNYIFNVFVHDKKLDKAMRLYILDKWEKVGDECEVVAPTSVRDIVVDDLGNEISDYQKRNCKKAFIEFANKENETFKVKNFWVMELVKQTVRPIDTLHEWSCHRIFAGKKKFNNIWVYDCPKANEEPYFFITNSAALKDTTKVAVLNFKSPTYHVKGIYKQRNVKAKGWKLDESYIKELIEFLKSPVDEDNSLDKGYYNKYVKTNWQHLIFEYNHNTAGWGWGENGFDIPLEKDTDRVSDVEALPFDLPIPEYLELLKDKYNQE